VTLRVLALHQTPGLGGQLRGTRETGFVEGIWLKCHPPLPLTRLTDFSFEQLRFFTDLFLRKGQGTTLYSALSPPSSPVPAAIMPAAPFLHGFDTPKSS